MLFDLSWKSELRSGNGVKIGLCFVLLAFSLFHILNLKGTCSHKGIVQHDV